MSKKKRLKKELQKAELASKRQARLAWAMEHDADLQESIASQLEAFRAKFGRDPGPNDPIFFDPNKDEPAPMSDDEGDVMLAEMVKATAQIGRPEWGYAYAKSGYLVSELNRDLIPEEGLRAWNQAIDEWFAMSEAERATTIQSLASGRRN